MKDSSNILTLIKGDDERDVILSRLYSISDKLNSMAEDPYLDQVHNKVIEAIDWYLRYADVHGYDLFGEGQGENKGEYAGESKVELKKDEGKKDKESERLEGHSSN